ncbi:PLC-like phosphodiesterase [Aspergillus taichungensis]|uniref:PLC-like phosphodiesterase n=1 Tax=Aspergillus taichungensis TaxID=482145 RepID=A0A2J5I8U5_9EURO|nr:PLC-like phosphodiesterase [Aspergillus taichungensis]
MLGLGVLALLPFAASKAIFSRQTACNNSPDLCAKSYGEITHLGAHDSPFVRDASTSFSTFGNQYFDTIVQLDAGVRMVTAQVHKEGSEWHLCHSLCETMDAGKLSSWLGKIKKWLDDNPNEVVTILLVNSDDATASDLNSEFDKAGVVKYAYKPASTTAPSSWPTLQKMIDDGTRLVTFISSLDNNAGAPYLMNEGNYIWENDYDVKSPSQFSCTPKRPSEVANNVATAKSSNRLPMLNHFLYAGSSGVIDIEYPNATYVSTTNAPSGGEGNLGDAAKKCKGEWGQAPSFILVDFFNKGPAIDTVDDLNGVSNAVGRKDLKDAEKTSDASTYHNVFKGLVEVVQKAKTGAHPSMGEWVWAGGDWGSLGGGIAV